MKKGTSKAIWLIVEIVLVIIAIILIAHVMGILNNWSESKSTAGTAAILTESINRVSEVADPNYKETVEIWMPQSDVGSVISRFGSNIPYLNKALGTGLDPKWVIYYGDGINAKYIVSRAAGDALDYIEVIEKEIDWDYYPRVCGKNDGKVCFGFFEREIKAKDSVLELKNPEMIKKFWILSPCKANVTVYYDETEGKVDFCYNEPPGGFGDWEYYCNGEMDGASQIWDNIDEFLTGGTFGTIIDWMSDKLGLSREIIQDGWPEDDWSVFSEFGDRGDTQHRCS